MHPSIIPFIPITYLVFILIPYLSPTRISQPKGYEPNGVLQCKINCAPADPLGTGAPRPQEYRRHAASTPLLPPSRKNSCLRHCSFPVTAKTASWEPSAVYYPLRRRPADISLPERLGPFGPKKSSDPHEVLLRKRWMWKY